MGCAASCRRPAWKSWKGHPLVAKYKLGKRLGAGAFSEVYRATHIATGEIRALKIVFWNNPEVHEQHKHILRKEVQLLSELSHSNIVKLYEWEEDPKCLVMALEYLEGGGLLEHLFEVDCYDEAHAAELFHQLLQAVAYMHNLNVMHRDIKPENIVFAHPPGRDKKRTPIVKLVDFGLARKYSSMRTVKARLGSPGFMSPETIKSERHTPAMDMYSLGVLLFVMLTGNKPMRREEARKLTYHAYEAHKYPKMANWTWTRLSKQAQSLVVKLLEKNPEKRMTAKAALQHEWIISKGGRENVQLTQVGTLATKLAQERKFKGLANAVLAMNRMNKVVGGDVESEGAGYLSYKRTGLAPSIRGKSNAILPVDGSESTREWVGPKIDKGIAPPPTVAEETTAALASAQDEGVPATDYVADDDASPSAPVDEPETLRPMGDVRQVPTEPVSAVVAGDAREIVQTEAVISEAAETTAVPDTYAPAVDAHDAGADSVSHDDAVATAPSGDTTADTPVVTSAPDGAVKLEDYLKAEGEAEEAAAEEQQPSEQPAAGGDVIMEDMDAEIEVVAPVGAGAHLEPAQDQEPSVEVQPLEAAFAQKAAGGVEEEDASDTIPAGHADTALVPVA